MRILIQDNAKSTGQARALEVRKWLEGHRLWGMTPTEVHRDVKAEVDGWASLADARDTLAALLPLVVAASFWLLQRKE